jgi:hypothetical protein
MRDWISDLLIFSAGIAGGVLITTIKPLVSAAKQRRTEMVARRARMLESIKQKHEEEILHKAFETTDAIRSELNSSLQTLRNTLMTVLDPSNEPSAKPRGRIVHLSKRRSGVE